MARSVGSGGQAAALDGGEIRGLLKTTRTIMHRKQNLQQSGLSARIQRYTELKQYRLNGYALCALF